MKTVGIIAEYNPFHFGHRYHIKHRHALRADESFHPKGFSDGSTRRAHWNGTQ